MSEIQNTKEDRRIALEKEVKAVENIGDKEQNQEKVSYTKMLEKEKISYRTV